MYQSCASHLGLDNKIKQMMGFDKLYLLLIKLSKQNNDPINDPINDPVNDPINLIKDDALNDIDLSILRTIKLNPGLNAKQISEKLHFQYSNITVDMVKNSLKRKLTKYVAFKGALKTGGYFVHEKKSSAIIIGIFILISSILVAWLVPLNLNLKRHC